MAAPINFNRCGVIAPSCIEAAIEFEMTRSFKLSHESKKACGNIAAPADDYGCALAAPRWVEPSGSAAPGGGFAAPGSFTHALPQPSTLSPTHSLTLALIHSGTPSRTHSLTRSLPHPLTPCTYLQSSTHGATVKSLVNDAAEKANAPSTCASCGVWDVSALCGICGHTLCAQCIACGFYCMCNEMNLIFCSSCGTETSSMDAHSGMQDQNPEPALLGGGLGTDGNETCAFKTACIKSPQKNFWDSNLT